MGRLVLLRQLHAQKVHAQPAGLVDGGGAAFELPGHPQREADGGQGHQQRPQAHGQQLGRQRELLAHGGSLAMAGGCVGCAGSIGIIGHRCCEVQACWDCFRDGG
jgi:hypothetical protein